MLRKQRQVSIHFDKPIEHVYRPGERVAGRFFREKSDDAEAELKYRFFSTCTISTPGQRISDAFDMYTHSGSVKLPKSERTVFFDFSIPARFNVNGVQNEAPTLKLLDGSTSTPSNVDWESKIDKAPPSIRMRAEGCKVDISYLVTASLVEDSDPSARRRSIFKKESNDETTAEVLFTTDQEYDWMEPALTQHDQVLQAGLWYETAFHYFDINWFATLPRRLVIGEDIGIKWTLDAPDLPMEALDEIRGVAELSLHGQVCCHWGSCSDVANVEQKRHLVNTTVFKRWSRPFAHFGKELHTVMEHSWTYPGSVSASEFGPSFDSKVSRQYVLTFKVSLDGKKTAKNGFKYSSKNTLGWFQQSVVVLSKSCKPDWVETRAPERATAGYNDSLPSYPGSSANAGLPTYEASASATGSRENGQPSGSGSGTGATCARFPTAEEEKKNLAGREE